MRLPLLFVLASTLAVGQAKEKKFEGDPKATPGMNWQGQTVRATGSGAPDLKASNPAQARLGAERAALLDAMRNLLSQVKGVQIDGSKKMSDAMTDDRIAARVEGVVKNYRVVGKRYFSDGGVEVDVEVSVAYLTDVFDPDPVQQLPTKTEGPKDNTGLVIDARGLKVTPALAPRLLDDAGKTVYSVDSLSADARKMTGVASYVQSLEDAKKTLKVGDKPLVVKASKAQGADILLAADDAKKLRDINAGFLTEGKVVIVTN
ncbi:MAG: LPP20 family lipoprotein [Myxococcaceae bacterium]